MKIRKVILTEEAEKDIDAISLWIAMEGSVSTALRFTGKIRKHLASFDIASERGSKRSEVEPGLRVVGFAKSVTIAFKVYPEEVTIQRVYYRGMDWTGSFPADYSGD